jgi:hypothetical protein
MHLIVAGGARPDKSSIIVITFIAIVIVHDSVGDGEGA